jgi:sugar (pentulose or hexulose) kinase
MVMTTNTPTINLLKKDLSVMPHPGEAGLSTLAVCPTGNTVLNWARDLLGISIEEIEDYLSDKVYEPSPVLAVPNLSGSMTYWEGGRNSKGALIGLTLASSKTDVVQSLMESIASNGEWWAIKIPLAQGGRGWVTVNFVEVDNIVDVPVIE